MTTIVKHQTVPMPAKELLEEALTLQEVFKGKIPASINLEIDRLMARIKADNKIEEIRIDVNGTEIIY